MANPRVFFLDFFRVEIAFHKFPSFLLPTPLLLLPILTDSLVFGENKYKSGSRKVENGHKMDVKYTYIHCIIQIFITWDAKNTTLLQFLSQGDNICIVEQSNEQGEHRSERLHKHDVKSWWGSIIHKLTEVEESDFPGVPKVGGVLLGSTFVISLSHF